MLTKSILIIKKVISIIIGLMLIISIFVGIFHNKVEATYNTKFKDYPGYEELLKKLQEAHPNWEFEIFETGLTWNEAVVAESTGGHGKNVVSKNSASAWKCGCSTVTDPDWTCASLATVAYYMDTRNSLNEDYIFQFEQLTYDASTQTKEGVEAIIADCNYMQGKITYLDTNGNTKTINKTYVDVIIEAAKKYNVSPYHLASRIRQEQGAGNAGPMISGKWTGCEGKLKGYYNYFNVNAYGATESLIFERGLTYASKHGWTDPEKAILGGANFLSKEYISCGQDTLYLQKFNVADRNNYYSHQYMTNVSASKTEAEEIREAYRDMGMLTKESKIKFKIPVYKNMPTTRAAMPGMEKIVTQDVKINANNVSVKAEKKESSSNIATLNKDTKILRIELDNNKDSNGKYWDKVVLNNGKKGYISREYLTQIDLQSNCKESYIVSKYTNFRNGPGTKGNITTTIIKLLSPGQLLTVVEKGKYENVDGEAWYRVQIADGTYGYVGTEYIEAYDASKIDRVKVVCSDGLKIRKEPSTSAPVLKAVAKGTILTRTEKDVKSSDSNYVWDKVTTSSGTVGYVVRQDPETKKAWIEPITTTNNGGSSGNTSTQTPNINGAGFKTSGTNLICQPNMTVENIKKVATDAVIKNGSTIKTSGNVATGWTITYKGKTFTIVVLGDVNGDGKVNTGDTLAMSQHIENFKKITNNNYLKAADTNEDGKINTGDSLKLRQHVEKFKIIQF